ncbi:type II secretion system F family protein [Isoptericola aurantiacus]|uniref:type II secretion system F family protein n=1 Tax=Isoptericola aurantiacus TaxID=3377839 RepID=UPI00383AE877
MTFVLVTGLVLLAGLPWWWAHAAARRRLGATHPGSAPAAGPGSASSAGDRVDVVVLLELVAAAVRSGAGVPRALDAVGSAVGGDDGRALGAVSAGLRLGADWESAWDEAAGPGGAHLDPVRRALRGAWSDGASPGEALRAAGADLLHERRAAGRTAAARLAVRLVLPLGLCYLPAFVLVGLAPVLLALGLDLLSG